MLRDYIDSGTETHGQVRRLSFDRDVETAIYNAFPHHLTRLLRAHPLRCQMAFVRGTESAETRRAGLIATQRLAQGRISSIEGSHLFPLERPFETAAEVVRLIDSLRVPARPPPL
jgi:hypothetical protein